MLYVLVAIIILGNSTSILFYFNMLALLNSGITIKKTIKEYFDEDSFMQSINTDERYKGKYEIARRNKTSYLIEKYYGFLPGFRTIEDVKSISTYSYIPVLYIVIKRTSKGIIIKYKLSISFTLLSIMLLVSAFWLMIVEPKEIFAILMGLFIVCIIPLIIFLNGLGIQRNRIDEMLENN